MCDGHTGSDVIDEDAEEELKIFSYDNVIFIIFLKLLSMCC